MQLENILSGEALAAALTAIQRINAVWDLVKGTVPGAAYLDKLLRDNWVGYGVSVRQPGITFYFIDPPNVLADLIGIFTFPAQSFLPLSIRGVQRAREIPSATASSGLDGALQPGAQILAEGPIAGQSGVGTLGAFAVRESETWILSANHVMGFNERRDPKKVVCGAQQVSEHVRFAPLDRDADNVADVAAARYTGSAPPQPHFPGLPVTGEFPLFVMPPGSPVSKIGAAPPHRTDGILIELCPRLILGLPSCGIPSATMVDQWLVADAGDVPFSDEGDSGALALIGVDGFRFPFGFVIGEQKAAHGGRRVTIVSPYRASMCALGLNLRLQLE